MILPAMCYFDAHCHLQNPGIVNSFNDVIRQWVSIGGKTLVCCATSELDWQNVLELSHRLEPLLPNFGIHPWHAGDVSGDWESGLEKFIARGGAGIGEIGLDFTVDNPNRVVQESVFLRQMEMAADLRLPVSVHIRKAWDVFFHVLKRMGTLCPGGLIHSYSGSADMVPQLEQYGFYISFSGSVTNPSNKKIKKALKAVSDHRVLIETDSPDMMPFCNDGAGKYHPLKDMEQKPDRGMRASSRYHRKGMAACPARFACGINEPANLPLIAMAVSELLGKDMDEVIRQTAVNGYRLFASARGDYRK